MLVNETRASELAAGRDAPLFYLSYFGWGHPPSHGLDSSQGVVYTHSSVSGTSAMPRHIRSITVHMDGSNKRKKVYLAVGASIFQGVYNSIATGPWNAWFELQWRRMRRCLKRLHSSGENDFYAVMASQPDRFKEFALNYDGYRLARMCVFIQYRLFPFAKTHPCDAGARAFAMSRRISMSETAFLFMSWIRSVYTLCWMDRRPPKLAQAKCLI